MSRTVLPLLDVADREEVDQLRLENGTVNAEGPTCAGILRTIKREYGLTDVDAFAFLDRSGWSNGYLMIPEPEQ